MEYNGWHYSDVMMGAIASQITSFRIVCSTVYSDADQRKHQSSASLAFVRGIHRRPVNFPHKWPVTRKMFPFDDVIMQYRKLVWNVPYLHGMWLKGLRCKNSNLVIWQYCIELSANKVEARIGWWTFSNTFSWKRYLVFWSSFLTLYVLNFSEGT